MISNFIVHAALAIVPIILAITLHETAHGFAALALGDTTARDQGRLSLNPLRHIDKTGTIILPGILLISQLLTIHRVAFMFGWAKPVPIAAWKFRDPRRGMALVAAAGPAMNFFLAWLTALAMRLTTEANVGASWTTVMFDFMLVNMVLGLFNLLPIPPLDGGRVVAGFLSDDLARFWAKLERYGLMIVIVLLLVLPNVLDINPVGDALEVIMPHAFRIVFWLAGYHE